MIQIGRWFLKSSVKWLPILGHNFVIVSGVCSGVKVAGTWG
jgi:hypothetical protein